MALIDTGLGWYADDSWLKQSSGEFGEVTPGTYELLRETSPNPISIGTNHNNNLTTFLAMSSSYDNYETYVYCVPVTGESFYTIGYVTNQPSTGLLVKVWDGTTLDVSGGFSDGSVGDWLYGTFVGRNPIPNSCKIDEPLVPIYPSGAAIATYLYNKKIFYKLNTGYAITCAIRYTNNGNTKIVPVCISSNPTYAAISYDGSTEGSHLTYSGLRQGVRMTAIVGTENADGDYSYTTPYLDLTSQGNITIEDIFDRVLAASKFGVGNIIDPYADMGTTAPSTPGGIRQVLSVAVPIPSTPSFAISDAGFFSIWIPTEGQIRSLAWWMWNGNIITLDFWKRMVTSPTDLILGLSILPFTISATGIATISMGYTSTGILSDYVDDQFFELDFGTLKLDEVWGAYLDYNPYTSVEIYLPFIGTRRLDVDEIMNKTLHLVYKVDIVSGACVAIIETETTSSVNSVLYQFIGNCATQIPITSEQMVNIVRNTISLVTSVGLLTANAATASATGGASLAGTAGLAGAASSAMNLATTKQSADRTGAVSSAAGLMGVLTPYLIIKRPRQAIPAAQNYYTGYPSFITEQLSLLSGYTEVEAIHLHNIPCMAEELDEIYKLLRTGVIL